MTNEAKDAVARALTTRLIRVHKATLVIAFVVTGVLSVKEGITARPAFTAAPICRPADTFSAMIIERLDTVLTSSAQTNATLRTAVAVTYTTTVSKIVLVTDERICGKVLDGVNAALQTPGRARQLYVVNTGGGFAALDPFPGTTGEYTPLLFLNKRYVMTGALNSF